MTPGESKLEVNKQVDFLKIVLKLIWLSLVVALTIYRKLDVLGVLSGTAFVSPTVIDMFGGNILDVSGPCFSENEVIALLFGDPSKPIAIGECFRFSEIKAKCEVPPLTGRGRVQVGVSLDGGVSISYRTSVTVGKVV